MCARARLHAYPNSLQYTIKYENNSIQLYATQLIIIGDRHTTISPVSQCNHLSLARARALFLSISLSHSVRLWNFIINTNNLVQMLSPKRQFQPCCMLYDYYVARAVLCCCCCCCAEPSRALYAALSHCIY